jgi:hypothetical protein
MDHRVNVSTAGMYIQGTLGSPKTQNIYLFQESRIRAAAGIKRIRQLGQRQALDVDAVCGSWHAFLCSICQFHRPSPMISTTSRPTSGRRRSMWLTFTPAYEGRRRSRWLTFTPGGDSICDFGTSKHCTGGGCPRGPHSCPSQSLPPTSLKRKCRMLQGRGSTSFVATTRSSSCARAIAGAHDLDRGVVD